MAEIVDTIADVLSRMCPLDAGTKEIMDKHWGAANRHAATEIVKDMPWRTSARRHDDGIYRALLKARRLRNEYIAKAVNG